MIYRNRGNSSIKMLNTYRCVDVRCTIDRNCDHIHLSFAWIDIVLLQDELERVSWEDHLIKSSKKQVMLDTHSASTNIWLNGALIRQELRSIINQMQEHRCTRPNAMLYHHVDVPHALNTAWQFPSIFWEPYADVCIQETFFVTKLPARTKFVGVEIFSPTLDMSGPQEGLGWLGSNGDVERTGRFYGDNG